MNAEESSAVVMAAEEEDVGQLTNEVIKMAAEGSYEGDRVDGMKHGQGKVTYVQVDVYDGGWVKDMKQGKGTYTYADGRCYEGDWRDGKRHGEGILKWSSSRDREGTDGDLAELADRYEGDFKDG